MNIYMCVTLPIDVLAKTLKPRVYTGRTAVGVTIYIQIYSKPTKNLYSQLHCQINIDLYSQPSKNCTLKPTQTRTLNQHRQVLSNQQRTVLSNQHRHVLSNQYTHVLSNHSLLYRKLYYYIN